MTPASNVLSLALSVLGHTPVTYYAFTGKSLDSAGYERSTYAAGVEYPNGSVQPVDRKVYGQYGLDFEKRYITWFIPSLQVTDIDRDVSGDIIETLGKRYQLKGGSDWFGIDGWMSVMGEQIGAATGALNNA
ncbi:hypothetical protein UFOVP138_60 [uncultured Caudovirales phage]|uniref:Uncharacterized protein n=1 Tax=uncultured Caudovirales phage TaxID=2100421 RepID=A0A6J5LKK8_9CAUD|nr:hypothetical protein UFOVP138_60 [uncultured Caudovirales phage]